MFESLLQLGTKCHPPCNLSDVGIRADVDGLCHDATGMDDKVNRISRRCDEPSLPFDSSYSPSIRRYEQRGM